MGNYTISPEAQGDLDRIHAYIWKENPDAADRVLEAALATFALLAKSPGIGWPRIFKSVELHDLRSFRIVGFRNFLIFYRSGKEDIEIVRVLHAARDLDALFGEG